MQTRSGVTPFTVNGSDHITEDQVRKYLVESGYADEAESLIKLAKKFLGGYRYSADRHRYVAFFGGFWVAGDSTISEEKIKSLSGAFRASNSISPSR